MADKKTEKASLKDRIQVIRLSIKWFWESSKILTILAFFSAALAGLISIIEPFLFKKVIDSIVENKGREIAKAFTAALFALIISYGFLRALQGIAWDIANKVRRVFRMRAEAHINSELLTKISSLDMVYFETPGYYNTLTKAGQNIWRVQDMLFDTTYLSAEITGLILSLTILLAYDARLPAIVAIGAIPSIILPFFFVNTVWSAYEGASPIIKHANYYHTLLSESPEAIKEIRLFGLQGHFLAQFKSLFSSFLRDQDKAAIKEGAASIVMALVEGAATVLAIYLIVRKYLTGEITLGTFTFLGALLFQFAAHAGGFARAIASFNTNTIFLNPILQVLRFKPTIKDPENPKQMPARLKEGIEFRNVTFRYPRSKKPALKNISFIIKPNENIALVGENGCGKTTLIKLLCRLYDVSKGEILVDGVNIKNYALKDLYDKIGVIFQDFTKYEALVEENIRYGRLKGSRKEIHEAALKSGAWNFIKNLEKSYKTPLGKKLSDEGQDLSIGQWQKIALARAFYKNAEVLILDEPTAAVDAKAEYELFKRFRKLTEGKTTILISHRFSTVRMADRIIVIDKGEIQEAGSHEQLMRKKGIYANLFNLQAEGFKA